MSVDALFKNKRVSWVQPDYWDLPDNERNKLNPLVIAHARKRGEFGPPLFDERKSTHNWRHFKKGFNWGFMMMTTAFYQISYYNRLFFPVRFTTPQLVILPPFGGAIIGFGYGFYEVLCNP